MKKYITFFFLFLFTMTAFAESHHKGEEIQLTPQFKLVPKIEHQKEMTLPYTIDMNYPQITGKKLSPSAKQFNHFIAMTIKKEAQQFKKEARYNTLTIKNLPATLKQNSLHMDYDIDLVEPKNTVLISIRFTIEKNLAGMAHPLHTYQVVNYNLTKGEPLELTELFKSPSSVLAIFSQYSTQQLNETIKNPNVLFKKGLEPTAKNYQFWNIQSDGVLITFPPSQVAPSVFGAKEVMIPYSVLQVAIAPRALIASCARDARTCEIN